MLTKIIFIAIIGAVILYYLKISAPEFFTPALVVCSIVLLVLIIEYIIKFLDFFQHLGAISGLSGQMILLIIKIIAISYLVEFIAGMINDMQLGSVADKVVLAGKIIVFSMTLPVIEQIISILTELL